MKRIPRHLPSPAMMVSLLAVFLALGGGSFAVASHLKVRASDIQKNAVRSKHIKNGQVKTPDLAGGAVATGTLRGGAVTAGKLRNNAINSVKVVDGSLKGADIDEGSLGKVPSAANADDANTADHANTANSANTATTANSATNADRVDGSHIRQFSYRANWNTGTQTVINNLGGLTLKASCWSGAGGFDPRLQATTATSNAYLRGLPNSTVDTDFDVGEEHDVTDLSGSGGGRGLVVYRRPVLGSSSGDVVTVNLAYDGSSSSSSSPNCQIYGTVVGG